MTYAEAKALKKPGFYSLTDADLGGGMVKQRIAGGNEGKSGGYRSIILFRFGDKAFFVYGFAENKRDNINQEELAGFKALADDNGKYYETTDVKRWG